MPGETTLPIDVTPDTFDTITFHGAIAEDLPAQHYFYYAERDVVVDAFYVINDTDDTDATVDLKDDGTSILTAALSIAGQDAVKTGSIDTSKNIISAGSLVTIHFASITEANNVVVQMRVRSKRK
jgi:hypothetical protein|tara:strand:+ start:172 stop:546 length:375 start_codon:yes stop_codon:yes gene_type:complete